MTLKEIERRITVLKERYPTPPTFEQFREEWERMDGLSKSLYEMELACPELAEKNGKYFETIRPYLLQMGIIPGEQFSLKELAKELTSDT